MSTLPVRIRQHIRDQFTAPTAKINTTISALSSELGHRIYLDPEWAMLWTTLQPYYPDQATFIPSIISIMITWFGAFTTWLESKDNEVAIERMLDALKKPGALDLTVEILPTGSRPKTVWRITTSSFVLLIPKATPISSQTVLAGFASDFLSLFTMSPSMVPSGPSALTSDGGAMNDDPDAWAELTLDSPVTHVMTSIEPGDGPLPDIAALERPEELTKRAPYYLIVRKVESPRYIIVEASHQESLLVMEGYLKRWVRHNPNLVGGPPVVELRLRESFFGLGLLYDALIIEPGKGRDIGVTMILVLAERILGYELMANRGVTGSVWEFRRTRNFL